MLDICINTVNSSLLNFLNVTVELLQSIFEHQKSLTIQLNDRLAGLDKTSLTYWDCFEYNNIEESKYLTTFALIDFEQLKIENQTLTEKIEERRFNILLLLLLLLLSILLLLLLLF
jgi:hypothetical protein